MNKNNEILFLLNKAIPPWRNLDSPKPCNDCKFSKALCPISPPQVIKEMELPQRLGRKLMEIYSNLCFNFIINYFIYHYYGNGIYVVNNNVEFWVFLAITKLFMIGFTSAHFLLPICFSPSSLSLFLFLPFYFLFLDTV